MENEGQPDDRRGTIWEWPGAVAFVGLLLTVVAVSNGAALGTLIGLAVLAFGVVALLARRGSFSPRRR